MILATKVNGVHIHTTIVGPIVGQRHNQLAADLRCCIDDFVERCYIDGRFTIYPSLEDDFSGPGTFSSVLRQSASDICCILVVEAPSAEDGKTCFSASRETKLDICLVLCRVSAIYISNGRISVEETYVVEWEVVSIRACKVKVLAIKLELRAGSCHETFRTFLGCGDYTATEKTERKHTRDVDKHDLNC